MEEGVQETPGSPFCSSSIASKCGMIQSWGWMMMRRKTREGETYLEGTVVVVGHDEVPDPVQAPLPQVRALESL